MDQTFLGGPTEPDVAIPIVAICGVGDLDCLDLANVSHALSLMDPGVPDPEVLKAIDPARRMILRFHDEIAPGDGIELPGPSDLEAVVAFGRQLADDARRRSCVRAVLHCQKGISRSTAAAATVLALLHPELEEDQIFSRVLQMRPQAWPNCLMIRMADDLLGRNGRLNEALGRLYARQLAARPELGPYMRENGRGIEVDMAESAGARIDCGLGQAPTT